MTDETTPPDVPALEEKCRLQWEEDEPVLLYPEGVVQLNQAGFQILDLVDGETSTEKIIETLQERHDRDDLTEDVETFLSGLREEGLIHDAGQ